MSGKTADNSGRRPKFSEPTDQHLLYADQFAKWQTQARKSVDWNIPDLVKATGYSDTYVRNLDLEGRAGIDIHGAYRRPSEEYIIKVASLTGANAALGLIAAGRRRDPPPNSLSQTRRLATGDEIKVSATDPNPDDTAEAMEAFLLVYKGRRDKKIG